MIRAAPSSRLFPYTTLFRSKVLDPPLLLDRLSRRLPVLAGGSRDAPERHRTLRATIDWSYGLLEAPLQAVFRRLRSEEHTSELQSLTNLVCRVLIEKKKRVV